MRADVTTRRRPVFDVFLSHSGADTQTVAQLADSLRKRGLMPWLDIEQVLPGVPFQPQLATGLEASRCFAVLVGAEEVGSWVHEELNAAITRSVADRSFRVFLVLLPTAPAHFDPTELHRFLSQRTWVDLRSVDDEGVAGDMLARAVRGEPLRLVGPGVEPQQGRLCPYVGLRPFGAEDAAWFFGRDADTQRMAEKLRRSRFLAVLGRSGAGKSSAVRAGLVPALGAGRLIEGSRSWLIRVLRPTATPLEVLATHVSQLRPDIEASQILKDLTTSDVSLKLLTAGRQAHEPVVWIVDQAEELFTLCRDADERAAFTGNLLHASQTSAAARVVVVLRSDFYARFAELEAFSARIAHNQHVVTDLDDQQLEQVVTQPAALVGLSLEAGLVERIMADVHSQAGALPLLQHALRELWERRRGSTLTHDAYGQIGGVEGALANRADEVLAELDEAGDLPVARRLLLELTRLGEGAEDTKQPARLSKIAAPAYPLDRLHRVAARLADARLVTTGTTDRANRPEDGDDGDPAPPDADPGPDIDDTVVDLAHEALIRSWPTLRAWLEESRDDERARRRIRDAARAWDEQGRPDDLLYRGSALVATRERLSGERAEMPDLETEFLTTSLDREHMERVRNRYRQRRQLAVLGTLSVLTLVAAIVASGLFLTTRQAQIQAEHNAARALAQQALALASDQPALALAVSAEALHRYRSPETANALQAAHLAYGQTPGHSEGELTGHNHGVSGIAFNQDGSLVATASGDGTARLWDASSRETVVELIGHSGAVSDVAFSPVGHLVATASNDGSARVWDASTGAELSVLRGHSDGISDVAFSPDGHQVATASRDGTVRLWEWSTRSEMTSLASGHGARAGIAFSPDPDSPLVATANWDGTATVWNRVSGAEVTLRGHENSVTDVAFSPDGTRVATASGDETVKLWDAMSGTALTTLRGHRGDVSSVAFSPNGLLIGTASDDRTARLWDVSTGDEVAVLTKHDAHVTAVAFSPGSSLVATASDDRTARLWTARAGDEVMTLTGHHYPVSDIAFSPDGQLLATASDDDTAKVWDAETGRQVADLVGHNAAVSAVAFSSDSSLVATASEDRTARLWNASTGVAVGTPLHHTDVVSDVAFSLNGDVLATASDDATAKVWEIGTGREIANLDRPNAHVSAVMFSPDGDVLATANSDGTATLWNPLTGEQKVTLGGSTEAFYTVPLNSVAFSPDGRLVATASQNGTMTLWDARTGSEVETLAGHDGAVSDVAFNHDGTLVATASADETVRLWDVNGRREIATLGGYQGDVSAVAFDPNGTFVAASSDLSALVRRLVLTPGEACDIIVDQITAADLADALGGDAAQACTNLD